MYFTRITNPKTFMKTKKKIKINKKTQLSSLVLRASLEVLNGHMGLVAAVLDSIDVEHLHQHRRF